MSQNSLILPTTGTVSGLQMTQFTNQALDTLNTLASGASAPSVPEAGQLWHDTTNNLLNIRSLDNTSWIPFLQLNESAYSALPYFTSQITGGLNRIINAAMNVDQVNEGGSYAVSTGGSAEYATDMWQVNCNSGSASGITAQRVTDAPPGFTKSLKITVGTGAASVGSSDLLTVAQPIEGNNISDFNYGTSNAITTSLSFWAKSSVSGTYSVAIGNGSSTRVYITTFNLTATNTWQKITIPNIPGDVSGTWATDSTQGMFILVALAAGTGLQTATLNAWQAAATIASTTQTSTILTTTAATFQITGAMFHPGVFSLPFEKRLVTQELQLCQRYYVKTFPPGTAVAQNAGITGSLWFPQTVGASTGTFSTLWSLPVLMRVSPTGITYNPAAANAQIRNISTSANWSATAVTQISQNGVFVIGTTPSGSAAGNAGAVHITADARM